MKASDSLVIAWRGVKHAGMRSFLTMLGIIIGISSVILLMSIGQSSQDYILGQVEGIGSNLIFVTPNAPSKGSKFAPPSAAFGVVIKTLKDQDLEALRREPSIDKVGVENHGQARAVYNDIDQTVTYTGVNFDYTQAVNLPTGRGVWFSAADVEDLNHVAVIGPQVAKDFFGEVDPLGKALRIKNISFQVVGILENKGSFLGANIDSMVFLPSTVVNKQLLGIDYYGGFVVSAKSDYNIDFVKGRITSILRSNHFIIDPNKDDFMMNTQEEVLSILGNITLIMSVFLTAIAAISLVVGGIGIMNIMLVSVVERTKEIGLRKAIGASNNDIMAQFLWESVMLTFFGGAIGVALGAGTSFLAYLAVNKWGGIVWTFALPLNSVLLAVAVSSFIGLVFGIYPARQAARKNPIDSLRYE